jgi:hypothetical protein
MKIVLQVELTVSSEEAWTEDFARREVAEAIVAYADESFDNGEDFGQVLSVDVTVLEVTR